jgi:hypothetical protein
MDSKCTNLLNCLSSNQKIYNKIVNKNIIKFNQELNEIQKEINSLNNLNLDLVSLIVSRDDVFLNEPILRIILGSDFFNTIVNFVPTYNDIEQKVKEQLEIGKKYILVGFGSFNEVFETIFYLTELYPDRLFITFANAQRFLNKNNIKSLQPNNLGYAKPYVELIIKDYNNLYINENKKLKVVGLYNKFQNPESKILLDELLAPFNIYIDWFDTTSFNPNEWLQYLNNLDYYFIIIWLVFDITFLNDKISIYYIKNYLYKAYFDTAILAYPFFVYRLQPFNNILSKSYFLYFNKEYLSPYFIIKDVIAATLLKDQYQKSNLYFNQFTEFNDFLDNENNFKLYFSNNIFKDFIPINLQQKIFLDFINLLSDESYKDFIRLDSQLQDIVIDRINSIKNKYITLSINQKINFQESFSVFYKDLTYGFVFNGFFNNNLGNIEFLGINFIESGDIIYNYNVSLISQCNVKGLLNNEINKLPTYIFLRLQDTTFNVAFRKNLYFSIQNASQQLLNRSPDYFNFVDNQFNSMNRIFQNMLWFYIYSAQNIDNDEIPYQTVFYVSQNKFNNQFNIRLLFNIIDDQTNKNLYFGFENKLGNENNIFSTISNNILNIINFSSFINLTSQENVQFNNILIGTDYYDKSYKKKIDNNFNILIDIKKIYETLNFLNINSIHNNNNLQSIMLSIYQEYIVKEDWLQQQIILNPNFSPIFDIPWNNILDNIGTIFEKNDKFYNIQYQMKNLDNIGYQSSKFYLWTNLDNNVPNIMRMINTEFIDDKFSYK